MKRPLMYFIVLVACAACVAATPNNAKSVLVIGFKDEVSKQVAEATLEAIFVGSQGVLYEELFQDPRSLEAIREKYPQRALRAPTTDELKKSLAYKVYVQLNEEAIDALIANKDKWENIEYIQRDYQVQKYE